MSGGPFARVPGMPSRSSGALGFLLGGSVHAYTGCCDEGCKNPFYSFGCTKDRSTCPHCGQSVCAYHAPVNNAGRGGLLGSGSRSGRAFGGHSDCPGPDASKESLLGVEPIRLSWCTHAIDHVNVPPEGKSLRLLIYNVGLLRLGPLANPPFTNERFRFLPERLLGSGADIIALQEIYEKSQVNELIEQVQGTYPYHARVSPEVSHMKKFASGLKFHNGLMYLSRYPIEAEALHVHAHAAAIERMMGCKAMLVVKVLTPLGRLLMVNMHTTAGGRDPEGVDAIRQSELAEALMACEQGRCDGYRPLVIGDLNMGPEASPLNYSFMLDHGYKDVVVQAAPEGMDITTWDPKNPLNKMGPHAKSPPQRCDHIFVHPQAYIACTSVQRIFTEAFVPTQKEGLVTLSDHYGLLATLGPSEED